MEIFTNERVRVTAEIKVTASFCIHDYWTNESMWQDTESYIEAFGYNGRTYIRFRTGDDDMPIDSACVKETPEQVAALYDEAVKHDAFLDDSHILIAKKQENDEFSQKNQERD